MRPRAILAASLLLGTALSVYACDNGTFDNEVPTYVAPEASTYVPPSEDAGEDGSADAALPSSDGGDAGEGGTAADSGEGGSAADSPSDAPDLDAADAGG